MAICGRHVADASQDSQWILEATISTVLLAPRSVKTHEMRLVTVNSAHVESRVRSLKGLIQDLLGTGLQVPGVVELNTTGLQQLFHLFTISKFCQQLIVLETNQLTQ